MRWSGCGFVIIFHPTVPTPLDVTLINVCYHPSLVTVLVPTRIFSCNYYFICPIMAPRKQNPMKNEQEHEQAEILALKDVKIEPGC